MFDGPPLVSIIIPTYNRADLVERAIESSRNQTYPNIEIVVVNNGSRDHTADVLKHYATDYRVRTVTLAENRGVGAAYNAGLAVARGVYATFLFDDDEFYPEAMAVLIAKAEEVGERVSQVFGDCTDADTGKAAGYGLDQEGFVTFQDAMTQKFSGEFSGIWRTKDFGSLRFLENAVGVEGLVWYELYRKKDAYYVKKPIRKYYQRRWDSISIPRFDPERLAGYIAVSERFVDQFGSDLLRFSPKQYAFHYYLLGMWKGLSGHRGEALDAWSKGNRVHPSVRGYLLLVALLVPTGLLKAVLVTRAVARKWGFGA